MIRCDLDEEQIDRRDLVDEGIEETIDPGLPSSPQAAEAEKHEIDHLLAMLDQLGPQDSKQDKFWGVLEQATADGRPVLVFTEYTDTMEYLRDQLRPVYGETLGCFSGKGGELWVGQKWVDVSKAEITDRLAERRLKLLICTDAASEGLNLQAAGALINYDLPWNPSKVEQRIGRIDRIGQTCAIVPVYNMFLVNSIDVNVYKVLHERCGLFEHFVGQMQPVLALARSALRRILSLEEEAQLIAQLQKTAEQVDEDATINAEFVEAEAEAIQAVTPPVDLKDLEMAIGWLQKTGGKVITKKFGAKQWSLRGVGRTALKVTTAFGKPGKR